MQIQRTLTIASIVVIAGAAGAGTLVVPSENYSTIQSAINAAIDGDDVLVHAGTWDEYLNFGGKAITVHSVEGAATTILERFDNVGMVMFTSGEGPDSVLEGFTLRGNVDASAGILIANSSPTIQHCEFRDIDSTSLGGGIAVVGGSPTISDCIFWSCEASRGAGVSVISAGDVVITDCDFTHGIAGDLGGAIYAYDSDSLAISGCSFLRNSVSSNSGWGGALGAGDTPTTVTDSSFTMNYFGTGGNGGGAYVWNGDYTFEGCYFQNNWVEGSTSGGAIKSQEANLTVNGSTFNTNKAAGGAAIYCYDGSASISDSRFDLNLNYGWGGSLSLTGMTGESSVSNCVFIDNTDTGETYGGAAGLDIANSEGVAVSGCTFADNTSMMLAGGLSIDADSTVTVSGSSFCNNLPANIDGAWTDDGNNTFAEACAVACCVAGECVGVMAIEDCWAQAGESHPGQSCDAVTCSTPLEGCEAVFDVGSGTYSFTAFDWQDFMWGIDVTLPDCDVIENIELRWGAVPNGANATLVISNDPNGDGHPSDGEVLLCEPISIDGSYAWGAYHFDPVPISGRTFVAVVFEGVADDYPASLDATSASRQSSWWQTGWADACDPWSEDAFVLDTIGYPGNWVIHVNTAQPPCAGDTDGDGLIGVNDILAVISAWGTDDPDADVSGNGVVDTDDVLLILSNWGSCL